MRWRRVLLLFIKMNLVDPKGETSNQNKRSGERFGKAPPTGSGGSKGGNIEPTFQNFVRLERNF